MAIRLDNAIQHGEISNEIRGLVTGRIWLHGRDAPLVLRLTGNCLRDLAGCMVTFRNPQPGPEDIAEALSDDQDGVVGDMTASRRARIPTVNEAELQQLLRKKKAIPTITANTLYLEWFSEQNGRVVVETTNCRVTVSEPAWEMTAEEERAQEAESQQNFYAFLDTITGEAHKTPQPSPFLPGQSGEAGEDPGASAPFVEDSGEGLEELLSRAGNDTGAGDGHMEEPSPSDEPLQALDEFEWERELREADRKAAAYQEALEKYRDSPDRDRRVAEAMGWEDGDDADLDFDWEDMDFCDGTVASSGVEDIFEDIFEDSDERCDPPGVPIRHPLSKRVTGLALHLQRDAEFRGLLKKYDPTGDHAGLGINPYLSVVMHIIELGGKLASALDGSVHGVDPEPGFVIAMLKRAQIPLNEALHAIGSLFTGHLDDNTAEWLEFARTELFDLRNEVLDIMRDLRAR